MSKINNHIRKHTVYDQCLLKHLIIEKTNPNLSKLLRLPSGNAGWNVKWCGCCVENTLAATQKVEPRITRGLGNSSPRHPLGGKESISEEKRIHRCSWWYNSQYPPNRSKTNAHQLMKGYVRGSTNTDKFPVRDAVQLEEGSPDAGTLGADSETTLRGDARHKGSPERDSIHRKRPEQAHPETGRRCPAAAGWGGENRD